ncbi:type IV pilin protein [Vibrio metoecus]|uniref:type IV pilin protein n=1 Tax=Vibrio metoecus TaxID=1481663 RepID=UPI0006D7DD6A|nr:pilin [Vibrio metoecus]KQA18464.1 pilus assembly protein PilA [Vibrio metoecus]
MKAYKNKLQKGFTLIELMIVVAIIGVLASIAVPAYSNYVKKSEAASALATLRSLITPAEMFYQEKGTAAAANISTDLGSSTTANNLGSITSALDSSSKPTLKFEFGANSSMANTDTLTFTRDTGGWTCVKAGTVPAIDGCQ